MDEKLLKDEPRPPVSRAENRRLSIQEYEAGEVTLRSRPRAVFVELTRNCNLRCFMCKPLATVGKAWNPAFDMPLAQFEQIAEQLFGLAEIVDLRGIGESTILKHFRKFHQKTFAYGCRVRLVTNLTTTDEELLAYLVEHDTMLAVSIDSPDPAAFEAIRVGAKFDRVRRNLEVLREVRMRTGLSSDMCIHCALFRRNLASLPELVRLAAEYAIPRLLIWPMDLPKTDGRSIIYHLDAMRDAIDAAFQTGDELGVEVRLGDWPVARDGSAKVLSRNVCIRPWMYMSVSHNGRLGYCDCCSDAPSLGKLNLFDQGVDAVWNSAPYVAMRRAFLSGIEDVAPIEPDCSRCSVKKFVDFDEVIYPPFAERIVNNHTPEL